MLVRVRVGKVNETVVSKLVLGKLRLPKGMSTKAVDRWFDARGASVVFLDVSVDGARFDIGVVQEKFEELFPQSDVEAWLSVSGVEL